MFMSNKKNKKKKIEYEYKTLLKDKDVERWYRNVERGSLVTADGYLRKLKWFCNEYNITPKKFVDMDIKKREDFLLDMNSNLEKKGYAGSYIAYIMKVIKSWLSYNGIVIVRKIKIKGAQDTPTVRDETVPEPKELKKILFSANKQGKTACILMAHSGVRPQILGKRTGEDGLIFKDFIEARIEEGHVVFDKTPTLMRVRSTISKTGRAYCTFLSEEGCEYLKEYLEERMRKGEKITGDSAIIKPSQSRKKQKKFISTTNIGDIIRKAIRNAGFEWRPMVLRRYFDTQLMSAKRQGLIIEDYRTFWMGHKGDIEHTYTLNKGMLPPSQIEEMRTAYQKCENLLQTTKTETGVDEKTLITRIDKLQDTMFRESIIRKAKEYHIPDAEVEKYLKRIDSKTFEELSFEEKEKIFMDEIEKKFREENQIVSDEEIPKTEKELRIPRKDFKNGSIDKFIENGYTVTVDDDLVYISRHKKPKQTPKTDTDASAKEGEGKTN